jgi:hypothetical protein
MPRRLFCARRFVGVISLNARTPAAKARIRTAGRRPLNKCPRIPPARAAGLLGEPKAKPTAQEGVERAGLAFALVADF